MCKKDIIRSGLPLIILSTIALSAALLILMLGNSGLIKQLELRTIDYRFLARGKKVPASPEIVVIALDNDSFEKNNEPFVFWPRHITEVTRKLVENGVAVVGIDVIQSISLEEHYPGHTKRMQEALLTGKVVLISIVDPGRKVIYSIPQITAVAGRGNCGPSNFIPDADNVIRRQPIHFENISGDAGGLQLISFAPLIASKYFGQKIVQGKDGIFRIGGKEIRDKNGRITINYAGSAGTFKTYSFHKVLRHAMDNDDTYFLDNFKDKIVLMGRTDSIGKDYFDIPFSASSKKMMSGIEIHANTINTILQGAYFTPMGKTTTVIIILFFCFLTAFLCYYTGPLWSAVISVGILLLYVVASFLLFINSGQVTNLVLPSLSIPLVFGTTFVYRYLTVNRRMSEIRDTFGRLVSREVEEELWKENLKPRPGRGTSKKVTILFSDINNFTPKCEKHSAGEIMEMLNEYYTRMIEVVFDNRGTVKQFVGDEIMVLFGAPHNQPHQAILAVRTAIDMILALRETKQSKGEPGFYEVKIGIHTGEVVAGFLGSIQRMQYTTIGDSVNLAARIESHNKVLDAEILISEDTYKELMAEEENLKIWLDDVDLINRGAHNLKGFKREFTLFEVRLKEEMK